MPTLINRLEPYPLERLSSFMERLRRANYYEEPRWYELLLPSRLPVPLDHLRSEAHFCALADLTGLTPATLYGMTIHRLLPAYLPTWSTRQQVFWDDSGRARYLHSHQIGKVCPRCIRDFGALFLPWRARHVTTCRVHRVLLVDTCPTCARPLRPDFHRLVCRGCLTSLADLPVITIANHPPSIGLTRLVWSALGCTIPFPPPLLPFPDPHPIRQMQSRHLIDLLWDGYHLLRSYDGGNPLFASSHLLPGTTWDDPPRDLRVAPVAAVHGALTAMWRLLNDWPAAWEQILGRILQYGTPSGASRAFPAALTEYFDGSEWAWLHQSWADYVRGQLHRNPQIVPWLRYYRGMHNGQLPYSAPPLLTQREAARTLGVSDDQLREFVVRGELRATALPEKSTARQWQFIEASSVDELREARAHHMTLRQTSQALSISTEQVVALVGAGMLDAVSGPLIDSRAVWRFDPMVVHACLDRVLRQLPVQPIPVHSHGVSPFAAVQRVLTRYAIRLPRLLLDIQGGLLPMVRSVDDVRFDVLWCNTSDLTAYQQGIRTTTRALLSVNEVCARLECKAATLRRLYGAGLLVPMSDDTDRAAVRHQYAEEDIAAFRERYVDSQEAAQILGVTPLTVQAWARAGRITPLTGPEIDGSHAYRFEKAALVQWRRERLTFGEAMAFLGVSKATLDRWAKQGKLASLADMDGKQRWFARADVERLRAVEE